MRVVFTDAAKLSLRQIALYIAKDNKSRAISFVGELRERASELGETPRAFPIVHRYERFGIRRRPYRNYLIFYQIEPDRVVIVNIVHGAMDIDALLLPDG